MVVVAAGSDETKTKTNTKRHDPFPLSLTFTKPNPSNLKPNPSNQLLQVIGWGVAFTVRVDPLASSPDSGFTHHGSDSPAVVFYFLFALELGLAGS